MQLRDILQKIGKSDKALLSYALEADLPQWVEYEPGKFVGVNVQSSQLLMIESECGSYQLGTIHREEIKL